MASDLLIGLLLGVGGGAWVYSKMMKSSGSNTQSSLITAAVAGLIIMLLAVTLLKMFLSGE